LDFKFLVCGLGKLGLCLATKLAESRETLGYDINKHLVDSLSAQTFSTTEPGLDLLLDSNSSRLKFYSDLSFLPPDELLIFIVVPTPSKIDASFDTKYVYNLIDSLLPWLRSKQTPTHLVLVSTVMPGATQQIKDYISNSLGHPACQSISVTYNPEFIALGSVLFDMEYPDILLLGQPSDPTPLDQRAIQLILQSYDHIHKSQPEHHILTYYEAELTKLSINTYLTQKISFANNITILTDSLPDSSATAVLNAIGADTRIGKKYLKPGLGFGGPCLPRDTRAFTRLSDDLNLPAWMPISVQKIDRAIYTHHYTRIASLLRDNLVDHIIFDGVTYKPGSWLLEDSPTLKLIEEVYSNYGEKLAYTYSDPYETTVSPILRSSHPYLSPFNPNTPPQKALVIRCHPGSSLTDYSSIQKLIFYTPLDPSPTASVRKPSLSQTRTIRRISLPPTVSNCFRSFYLDVIDLRFEPQLHQLLTKDSDQHTYLHDKIHRMYDSDPDFLDSYIQVILHSLNAIDDQIVPEIILAQRFPTFRVQFPDNISVYQFHKDTHYNHPASEFNHLFYLDQSYGSSSLHIESQYAEPYQIYSDYRDLSFGDHDLIQLNTSNYWHGDLPNLTGKTRYSIDFRLLLNPEEANALPTHSGSRLFTSTSYYRNFNTRTCTFED